MFEINSNFKPAGDQPQAIQKLTDGVLNNKQHQILMGVTGSGKTYTIANVIANTQKPTLVIAHNKTLAAQLCAEFREFFPNNAVEYFVSYYDYYQPEAYLPTRDVYIEKEADINEEIERLRHSATRSLLTRNDVIIVASVSCIYGLGSPQEYLESVINLKLHEKINRKDLFLKLENIHYQRNDTELKRGLYQVKGDTILIFPSWDNWLISLNFFGDELERIATLHPVTKKVINELMKTEIFPATHFVMSETYKPGIKLIEEELAMHVAEFKKAGKLVEAERIEKRTKYDLEMINEIGYCKGIENYSRPLSGREPGSAPAVLLDFFPDDFLTIIDESHASIGQIRGMFNGDQARKKVLIDYGFRLPSATDNRPLNFQEFTAKIKQCIYVSATPGDYELNLTNSLSQDSAEKSLWTGPNLVEQIIRPTGLVDPEISIRPTKNQIDDILIEVTKVLERKERILITTITKRMAEQISDYLKEKQLKVQYLHSEVHSLDRLDILHDLRTGKYDIVVGVNLLREGLDLPEVSLVIILDADKEGFLRNERSLIQTMGRAARNINGKVIMYADKITKSIERAVQETKRRRHLQLAYNLEHNITPETIVKEIKDIRSEDRELLKEIKTDLEKITPSELPVVISNLKKQMQKAAQNLEFELAAVIRDQIMNLENQS